jgi:pescadillo protein
MLEKQYHEELKMEIEGNTFSNIANKGDIPDNVNEDGSEEANEAVNSIKQAAEDDEDLLKATMSNRKRGLLKAMEVHVIILYMHQYIKPISRC